MAMSLYEPALTGFQDRPRGLGSACRVDLRAALLCSLLLLAGCPSASTSTIPSFTPLVDKDVLSVVRQQFPHGYAIGDVTSSSALLWFQGTEAGPVHVEWQAGGASATRGWQSLSVNLSKDRDLAVTVLLSGLEPGTTYRFRVIPGVTPGQPVSKRLVAEGLEGQFTTAPSPARSQPVTFVWSADLGGQQRCRRHERGYPIFESMRQTRPAFALLLGDTIYGDDRCPSPPNMPGSDLLATSLETFREKHRYQRGATDLQRFLREVPIVATWDDHEVRNNFSGPSEPLMAFGRQAFLEYWPIQGPADEGFRLHRSLRWGQDVELFVLDTRQYRSDNGEPDGPGKSMLGASQRDWLLDALTRSHATWKVIVSTVPVSIPKPGSKLIPGIDSWAKGEDGTGFSNELSRIVATIMAQPVRNVVWLSADVHYPQINAYDPDGDGTPDFHEFIAGPLSASPGRLAPLDQTFHPTTLYTETGFYNFGVVTIAGEELRLEIRDEAGAVRYTNTFQARRAVRP